MTNEFWISSWPSFTLYLSRNKVFIIKLNVFIWVLLFNVRWFGVQLGYSLSEFKASQNMFSLEQNLFCCNTLGSNCSSEADFSLNWTGFATLWIQTNYTLHQLYPNCTPNHQTLKCWSSGQSGSLIQVKGFRI
jgi:hypothetical protein